MANGFDLRGVKGLAQVEAERIFAADGPNELPSAKPRGIFAIAAEVVRQPMFVLLVAGGIIYLLLGDVQEALLLLGFVFVVIGITLNQERKTENALQALRNLSSPRARVIRGGDEKRIPGREVVRGDSVIIAEGDRVPADGIVLSSINLTVDESLLTGESAPVRKCDWDGRAGDQRPGGDDEPFVYSGTLVVQGLALMEVRKTGTHTEIGRIGRSLRTLEVEKTTLEKQTAKLVRNIAIAGGSLSAGVVIAYGFTRGDWLQGFLAGVALAMALLPEEFPVVLTIFLALGAWRISRKQVLTRRMPAVETLGSATVLCVDKTGTITLNQMTVGELYADGKHLRIDHGEKQALPEEFHSLVEFSILASQRDPFDPHGKAFHRLGKEHLARTEHIHRDWVLVQQYPLSKELLAMSHVWRSTKGEGYVIAAKGAPEAIADLCHFDQTQKEALSEQIAVMASNGLRVLGVASAYFTQTDELPDEQHDFWFEFVGLVGLVDPVRPSVPAAIRECHEAGIRVVMITGDYPATARNIASQIGLAYPEAIISGDELDAMSDSELRARIGSANVFARVVPEQKLRLVQALKANGEVVAMTGDGVNDAPALKASDIGVAMGGRGTDVAREAAGLVLLDDDFSSIVSAIRMGRRIFDNLRKAMAYIFAIHVPIAGLSLIPVAADWPLILLPIHIVFMELIIDPACSTVFEAEPGEADVMKRPPRDPEESIFDRRTVVMSLIQGLSILFVSLVVFIAGRFTGRAGEEIRTMAFTSLIVANLALILTNVSWSRSIVATLRTRNRPMWWVVGGAFTFLGLVLYVPFLSHMFRFSMISPLEVALCVGAGLASVLWFELAKLVMAREP
ncbi:MAG: cation-translocating P-type ATPase [Armatimonadetes bacterium]|nr:cation-translocating P-type ATPase [Armatimonadota bacterium]